VPCIVKYIYYTLLDVHYTMAEIVVNKGELKDIRDSIDKLLKSGGENAIGRTQFASYESEELSPRHKKILRYIGKNQGTTKEDVIKKNPDIGSRMTIIKSINDLIEMRMLIVTRDDSNQHIQHLHTNNEHIVLPLMNDLQFFKLVYFRLIDETRKRVEKFLIRYEKKMASPRDLDIMLDIPAQCLLESLLMPYKNLIIIYITSDLLLWHERPLDKKTLHNKFAIVYDSMKEIQTKLHESITPFVPSYEIFHIDALNVQLYRLQSGLGRQQLLSFLRDFWAFRLRAFVEPVLDIVWKIGYPVLRHDSLYASVDPEKLKDWRNVISGNEEFKYIPKTTQAENLGKLLR